MLLNWPIAFRLRNTPTQIATNILDMTHIQHLTFWKSLIPVKSVCFCFIFIYTKYHYVNKPCFTNSQSIIFLLNSRLYSDVWIIKNYTFWPISQTFFLTKLCQWLRLKFRRIYINYRTAFKNQPIPYRIFSYKRPRNDKC